MKDLNELSEFLKDDGNKNAFTELIKTMGYETKEDIQGLSDKNKQLIEKLKKARTEADEAKKILDEVDLNEYYELKEKLKSAQGADDIAKFQREIKSFEKKLNDAESRASTLQGKYFDTLKSNAITRAIRENKIAPEHEFLIRNAFSGKAKVETDGDKEIVLIDDGDGLGLPANEFFKKFVTTDQGKVYLEKPVNAGGGARGFSAAGGNGKTITRSEFDRLPGPQKSALMKEKVQVID